MNNLIMYNNVNNNYTKIKNGNKSNDINEYDNQCKFTFYLPNFKLLLKKLFCLD